MSLTHCHFDEIFKIENDNAITQSYNIFVIKKWNENVITPSYRIVIVYFEKKYIAENVITQLEFFPITALGSIMNTVAILKCWHTANKPRFKRFYVK